MLRGEGLAALKQLRLKQCDLMAPQADAELSACLSQLPTGLEHLSISSIRANRVTAKFPTIALQNLQKLTYLELAGTFLRAPDETTPAMQPLQALTRLVDLRLNILGVSSISAEMLCATHHLTRLELVRSDLDSKCRVEAGVLASKSRLQHLRIDRCQVLGAATGQAQLLSYLQPLQELTYLHLGSGRPTDSITSRRCRPGVIVYNPDATGSPPVAAYAALTASSKLQLLNISYSVLPESVWLQMFPTHRRLPYLTSLDISRVTLVHRTRFLLSNDAPECSCPVRCCPGLQELEMQGLLTFTTLLTPLQGLSKLHTLHLNPPRSGISPGDLRGVSQLTGLKELSLSFSGGDFGRNGMFLLLPLTQLKQLTLLECVYDGRVRYGCWTQKVRCHL